MPNSIQETSPGHEISYHSGIFRAKFPAMRAFMDRWAASRKLLAVKTGVLRLLMILFLIAGGAFARTIHLKAGTPIFAEPSANAAVTGLLNDANVQETRQVQRVFVETHPLARYYDYYLISRQGEPDAWVCPVLRYSKKVDGTAGIVSAYALPSWQVTTLVVTMALMLIAAGHWWRVCKATRLLSRMEARLLPFWPPLLIVLLRWTFLQIALAASHNVVTIAFDELGYFQVAGDLLQGHFSGPWKYLFGQGLLYVPFVWALQAKRYYDIAVIFSCFSAFVVMPACLLLLYGIIRRLGGSTKQAFLAGIGWSLLPFVYHYFPFWNEHVFKSFFAFPRFSFCFRFYALLIATGFNGMSDPWGTCLVYLCTYLSLRLPGRLRDLCLISALFGLACLIRLASIFYAPVIAYLFWTSLRKRNADWRSVRHALVLCFLTFSGVFLPQFCINWLHFGSIWIFPYILHNGAHDGFEWNFFRDGLQFLVRCNYAIWALAIPCLFAQKNRHLRTTLVLWAVPSILYFFGYNHTFCDAVRYLLGTYGPLLAAVALAVPNGKFLSADQCRRRYRVTAAVTGCLLFITPSDYAWPYQLPFDLQVLPGGRIVSLVLALGALLYLILVSVGIRNEPRLLLFCIGFAVVFLPACVWIFLTAFVVLLGQACLETARSVMGIPSLPSPAAD